MCRQPRHVCTSIQFHRNAQSSAPRTDADRHKCHSAPHRRSSGLSPPVPPPPVQTTLQTSAAVCSLVLRGVCDETGLSSQQQRAAQRYRVAKNRSELFVLLPSDIKWQALRLRERRVDIIRHPAQMLHLRSHESGNRVGCTVVQATPCVTFRRVAVPLRGPGRSPGLPFARCVGSLRSVGRCGRCSCWCRFRVRGAPSLVCRGCAECGMGCRLRVSAPPRIVTCELSRVVLLVEAKSAQHAAHADHKKEGNARQEQPNTALGAWARPVR